jgi:tRNA dimethylallyltransferase
MSSFLNPQSSILNPRIFCLMGPTGVGKSEVALELVRKFSCEIVSVDSAMVYRGMDIGTAKPSKEILAEIPHHLIDIRDPKDGYSVADFQTDVVSAIEDILARNKVPLLVGGTMMYFNALQQGLSDLPSADEKVRAQLAQEAKAIGWHKMHERLQQIDPQAAARIHANDSQRIQRVLEVFMITGKTITELQGKKEILPYDFINIALMPQDRAQLHERIALRFQKMLDDGFVDEVKKLYERGDLTRDMPSMRSVGYRQVWDYLVGDVDFATMQDKAIVATRQLAKRQLTWLRGWENLIRVDNVEDLLKKCNYLANL